MAPPAVVGFSALPEEALDEIARRVGPLDNVRCSAVCRSWRLALNATRLCGLGPQPSPHRISIERYSRPPVVEVYDTRGGGRGYHVQTVVNDAVARSRIIGCSYGWAVTVDDDTWAMTLLDPFTGRTFPLPPFSDTLPGKLRRETKSWTFQEHNRGNSRFWKHMFRKAALAPGRRLGTYAVMLLHSNGRGLSYLAPGATSWAALRLPQGMPHKYLDVILHKGAFYTISCYAELNAWVRDGHGSLRTRRLTNPLKEQVWAVLTESRSRDGILMVTSTEEEESHNYNSDYYWRKEYKVHRCVESERRWIPLKNLGKMTIMLGEGCSFCVPFGFGDGDTRVQASTSHWFLPYVATKDPTFR